MKKFFRLFLAVAIVAFLLVACAPAKGTSGVDMELVSGLVQKILEAVLPVLALQHVALLFTAFQNQRAKLTETQKFILDQGIEIAVLAAEKVWGAGNGKEKKAYALEVAQKWVASRGLKLDLVTLDAQIEAAVYEYLKNPPAPTDVVGPGGG